ncbi:uncharacterized protein EKO05_0010838 [Ascochyta rabiei]|uniref:Uncharacterized protein n=1 Tax=Didymella rabiei TaxID=5454 RepID=A0A163F4J6_DIDRA|nr:uncharacterized protein EKO05_0010838 [Ascochyta rabiei]KZM24143.1 hypothetical protein ST47_g4724 [Ascochyta rabiei]UPX20610.1 hypothetical protein EKO05_0010838 [Ascochyta rabiei]
MAFSNRYALLDQFALETVSKLRSLPEQDDEESMVAALNAQDESDSVRDAEWIAEKTAKRVARAVDGASAPAAPGRRISWADECQAEAEADAMTDAGVSVEVEADWERAEDSEDTTSHIRHSDTKLATTKRGLVPEWDDYIAGMPVFSAQAPDFAPAPFMHLRYTVESSWSASSSVRTPNHAAEASSDAGESKATTDTELEEVIAVQEKKEEEEEEEEQETIKTSADHERVESSAAMAEDAPITPLKSRKRRIQKATRKAATAKNVVAATESTDAIVKAHTNTSFMVEHAQAATGRTTEAGDPAQVSPHSGSGSSVVTAPSIEELPKPTLHINGKTALVDVGDAEFSIAAPEPQVETLGGVADLQDEDITPEDVFVDATTGGSTPVVAMEDLQPSSSTAQEALEEPVLEIDDAMTAAAGDKVSAQEAGNFLPKPSVPRKKKNQTKAQRRAAKEAAAAAAATDAESNVAAPTSGGDPVVDDQGVGAKEQEDEDVEMPPYPLRKNKPSGALRWKTSKAVAAAMGRPMELQAGSHFIPWYTVLAMITGQLFVLVVGIYLMM